MVNDNITAALRLTFQSVIEEEWPQVRQHLESRLARLSGAQEQE